MELANTLQEAPPNTKINRNLLKAQMALQGIDCKALANAEAWSTTTVYRKINGQTAWTVPEVQVCAELLCLDSDTASKIFFAGKLS